MGQFITLTKGQKKNTCNHFNSGSSQTQRHLFFSTCDAGQTINLLKILST